MSHIHSLDSWMCMGTYESQRDSGLSLNRLLSHQYSPPLCITERGSVKYREFLGVQYCSVERHYNPDKFLVLRGKRYCL